MQGEPQTENIKLKELSLKKKIIFSLIPLVVVFLLFEIASLALLHYRNSSDLAVHTVFLGIKRKIAQMQARRIVGSVPPDTWERLYASEEGADLLKYFQDKYTSYFDTLVHNVREGKSELVMLYIPTSDEKGQLSGAISRSFFSDLAREYNVPFVDTTDALSEYPTEAVTLLPNDSHPSRFGNFVIAKNLADFLEDHTNKSSTQYKTRPKNLGDLVPGSNTLYSERSSMVYAVHVNKQGFRNDFDLEFPKTKQRILVLGDSFTFGPYLPNHDTYPAILNRMYEDREFINAGVSGYTITDESGLFEERAKYVEPDIVVLQVLDNDLYGLFSFKMNEFDRKRRSFQPTEQEMYFLKSSNK